MTSIDVSLPSCLITITSPDFSQKIKLPTSIIEHFEGSIPSEAILKYGTRAWLVGVEKVDEGNVCFQHGWKLFVEDHSLELGDTLMLTSIGNSKFEFKVFDKNGGDKSSPSPSVRVETSRFEKEESFVVGSEMNNCEGLNVSSTTTKVKHPCKEEMPRFILYANQKMRYIAKFPGDFLQSVGDEELSDTVFLEDTDGKVWPIELRKDNLDQVWLHKGWDEFVKSRGLSKGQCLSLLFQYKGKSHFSVSIYVDSNKCELNNSGPKEKPSGGVQFSVFDMKGVPSEECFAPVRSSLSGEKRIRLGISSACVPVKRSRISWTPREKRFVEQQQPHQHGRNEDELDELEQSGEDEISKKTLASTSSRKKQTISRDLPRYVFHANEIERGFASFFRVVIRRGYSLQIPVDARRRHFPDGLEAVIVKASDTSDKRSWELKIHHLKGNDMRLSKGYSHFKYGMNLKIGDVLIFKIVEKRSNKLVLQVDVVRN